MKRKYNKCTKKSKQKMGVLVEEPCTKMLTQLQNLLLVIVSIYVLCPPLN